MDSGFLIHREPFGVFGRAQVWMVVTEYIDDAIEVKIDVGCHGCYSTCCFIRLCANGACVQEARQRMRQTNRAF